MPTYRLAGPIYARQWLPGEIATGWLANISGGNSGFKQARPDLYYARIRPYVPCWQFTLGPQPWPADGMSVPTSDTQGFVYAVPREWRNAQFFDWQTISQAITYFQTLAATAVGVATMSDVVTYVKTLAATAIGVATMSKKVSKFMSATAIGVATIVKKVSKTLNATAIGVASLTKVTTYRRTLTATAIGVATLSTVKTVVKTLTATAVGIASLTTLFIPAAGAGSFVSKLKRLRTKLIGR